MPACPSCAASQPPGAAACSRCGAPLGQSAALVSIPTRLPARRAPLLIPAGAATRLAVSAMLPALAGLLAREGMRYLLGRRDRETRLYRLRGAIVRRVNGHSETVLFDTELRGRRPRR